jgi:hypothetical protein
MWRRRFHGVMALSPHPMKFNLADGRLIELELLEQHRTYAGVLCGRFTAADHDRRIARFVAETRERRPWLGEIHVIPPARKPLPYRADSSAPVAELLPDVTTLARFHSSTPARDESEQFSTAVFVWFQDGFGLPDDRAIEALREVDWNASARDGTY